MEMKLGYITDSLKWEYQVTAAIVERKSPCYHSLADMTNISEYTDTNTWGNGWICAKCVLVVRNDI